MSTNKIKAGEAFILIRAIDKTAPVLQKVSQRFDQVGANIRNFGLVIGGIGAAITGVFIKPLKVASEVTEQQNKFFQVFGTHVGKEVEARLKGIAQETGRSHLKMYKFASAFGGLLKGQGATTRQAADMSKALVSMGVDFSSFNDIMDDTREGSMRRFVSALSGSAEVLDQYGVAAKESALGPALQQMFGVGVRGATELQKSTARAFLIFKSMKLQQALGDAPRTMHQLANVVRNIKDQFYDLNYAIGKAVLPVVGKLAQYFLKLVMWTKEWVDAHKNLILWVGIIGSLFLGVGGIIVGLGVGIQVMGFMLSTVATILLAIKAIWIGIAAVVAFISANFWSIVAVLGVIVVATTMLLHTFTAITRGLGDLLGWLQITGQAIWKAFSTGRFELAWKLFFNMLKLGWEYVVLGVQKTSAAITNALLGAITWTVTGIRNAFDATWSYLKQGWWSVQESILQGVEAIVRWAANAFKAIGMSSTGNFLTKVAEGIEAHRAEMGPEARKEQQALRDRIQQRDAAAAEFMQHVRDVTEGWWKDNEANIAALKKEAFELQKEAFKPGTSKFVDQLDPDKIPGALAAASARVIIPAALEKGTAAAAKKGFENRQQQVLSDLLQATEDGNDQRARGNEMLQEMLANTGAV
jgi:hypothetical protein